MKKIFIALALINLCSCYMDRNDLKVSIINLSKNKVYVGELYECDSCGIMQDVRLYCSHGNDKTFFPQMLNAEDSTYMKTKLHNVQKIDVINADSLEDYCRKGDTYNIAKKKWVNILVEKVDFKNKTCRIVIR